MNLISNIVFNGSNDKPAPGGRAVFLNQNNKDVFRPDGSLGHDALIQVAKDCEQKNGVLVLEDEFSNYPTLSVSIRVPYCQDLIIKAVNHCSRVMFYGRPSQAQWAIHDYDLTYTGWFARDYKTFLADMATIYYEKWRSGNQLERDGGLYSCLTASMTEYRLYHSDFNLSAIVRLTVAEQRRMGLPVCAFIDPRFAPGGGIEPSLTGEWVPRSMMQIMLRELALQRVEWLCLWHGSPEPRTQAWNDLFTDIEEAFPGTI